MLPLRSPVLVSICEADTEAADGASSVCSFSSVPSLLDPAAESPEPDRNVTSTELVREVKDKAVVVVESEEVTEEEALLVLLQPLFL